eukprot:254887_1
MHFNTNHSESPKSNRKLTSLIALSNPVAFDHLLAMTETAGPDSLHPDPQSFSNSLEGGTLFFEEDENDQSQKTNEIDDDFILKSATSGDAREELT